eukprot:CAMPEP_0171084358 /NCGR_PEP_ID=MMETSP0766_2-20121228/18269_1 /TAXON_ID=439317 /ORGANISM="Gambierdiscus australes, Strain CAWD 149" /LENGTH=37 /DNA_ID= /DNA_START= /DNA_END= /DNA_ORIENTATION=
MWAGGTVVSFAKTCALSERTVHGAMEAHPDCNAGQGG